MNSNFEIIDKYIKKSYDGSLNIQEISNKLKISHSAIIRYCKKKGYSGFKEFKFKFENELRRKKDWSKNLFNDNYVFSLVRTLENTSYEKIDTIARAIHKYKKINIIAEGYAFNVANNFMRMLRKININVVNFNSSEDYQLIIPEDNTVLLFISLSGNNKKFIKIINKIKLSDKNNVIFSIAGGYKSMIENNANETIKCFSHQDHINMKEYPMTPIINVSVIINLIFEKIYMWNVKTNDEITDKIKSK